jgi:hypothetical protein
MTSQPARTMRHNPDVGRRGGRFFAGTLGAIGSAACSVSMILVAVGVGGSAAAGAWPP